MQTGMKSCSPVRKGDAVAAAELVFMCVYQVTDKLISTSL